MFFSEPLEPRRLLAAGDLDLFYGNAGVESVPVGDNSSGTLAHAVVALPDGRAYVGGYGLNDVTLARLMFDGSPDPTFGAGGVVKTDILGGNSEVIESLVVQSDGKIVALASCRAPGKTVDFALLRYNPDGTLDTTFGTSGLVTTDFGTSTKGYEEQPTRLILQADGKIVALGNSWNGNKTFAVAARYNTDGSLDATFASGGKLFVDLSNDGGGIGGTFNAGLALDDGNLLLCGTAYYSSNFGPPKLILARLLPSGQFDTTFGSAGQVRLVNSYPYAANITPAPGGGYFVNAGYNNIWGVLRFNGDGTLDATWGASGIAQLATTSGSSSFVGGGDIAVEPDGSIVASHGFDHGYDVGHVLPTGQVDSSFGSAGVVNVNLGTYGEGGKGLALQPHGRVLVVGGFVSYPTPILDGMIVTRYRTLGDTHGVLLDAGAIEVTGDANANNISVSSDAGNLLITLDGVTQQFAAAAVSRVDVRALGGDDQVTIGSGAPVGGVDLAAGNDSATFDAVAPATDVRHVFGGDGTDVVTFSDGASTTAPLTNFTFDGGAGSDTLILNGTAGDDSVLLQYNNLSGMGFSGSYAANEHVAVNTLDGNDSISSKGNLTTATTVSGGAGDDFASVLPWSIGDTGPVVTLAGNAGSDTFSFTGLSGGETISAGTTLGQGSLTLASLGTFENLQLYALDGNDTVSVDASQFPGSITADGGAGTDTLIFKGGSGDDAINLTASALSDNGGANTPLSNVEAVSIAGNSGNDTITMSSAPALPVTVSGAAGNDTFSINAAPTALLTFQGGTEVGYNDTLNVNAGTYTFGADAKVLTSNLTINVNNGGTAIFNTSQRLAALNVADGGFARLSASGARAILTRGLSITGGGKLDLTNNDLAFDYIAGASSLGSWNGSSYTGVTGLIASGRNGGGWDAGGLVTSQSSAIAPNSLTTLAVAEATDVLGLSASQTVLWDGLTVDATTVLVKYTYAGDANLDGVINGDDYFQIDSASGQSRHGWSNGDFNYDSVVDGDDYFLIDSNFPAQAGPL